MATAAANPQWIYGVGMPSTYPDFKAMKEAGTGIVVADNLPGAADLIKAAKENGVPVAIHVWADPGSTPEQYAAKVAHWQQYHPDVVQLNIETPGKGYGPRAGSPLGDPGWQWSEKASQLLAPIVKGTKVTIGVMGQQDDFNYAAYMKNLNADFWVETYSGDMKPNGTPQSNVDRLVANGVPRDRITPILGPGQTAPDGNWISFGMPNSSAAGVYKNYATVGGWQGQGGPSTPAAPGSVPPPNQQQAEGPRVFTNMKGGSQVSNQAGWTQVPDAQGGWTQVPNQAGWTQVTDAHNPRAVKYAQQRLAQLQKQGYSPKDFGITGDPTAQWRGMSTLLGAQQAISSGHAADYHVGADVPPAVRDYVNKLLAAAQTPDTAPPGDDVVRPAPSAPTPPPQPVTHVPDVAGLVQAATLARRAAPPTARPAPTPVHTALGQVIQNPHAPAVVPLHPPLQPHQLPPPVPAVQRVGPMQRAIQVAAALRTLRQIRPTGMAGRAS